MGLEQTLSEGVVSAIRKTPPFGEILQITAPISRGSSGSPVVNMKGEVVGIATFLLKEGQNLNFAIPGGRALALKAGEERPQPVGPFFPLSDSQKKSIEAKSLIEQAEDLHDKGEHEKAISVLKQAIRLNPHDPLAHYDLGTICLHIRRYQEAVASFKQAINLEPDYAEAYVNMAVAYRELKQYRKAIAAVKQAINMEPDLAEAHNTLGVTYEVMGRYREAEVAIKQAIRLAPDNPKAHLNLGVVYARQGLHQESIREYQQAIKLKPDYVLAHYNLGGAYLSMGNTGAALEQYKILKNLDPDRANGLFNRIYK
jgi:tetratricopeptide (TPR) repeat protein